MKQIKKLKLALDVLRDMHREKQEQIEAKPFKHILKKEKILIANTTSLLIMKIDSMEQ